MDRLKIDHKFDLNFKKIYETTLGFFLLSLFLGPEQSGGLHVLGLA